MIPHIYMNRKTRAALIAFLEAKGPVNPESIAYDLNLTPTLATALLSELAQAGAIAMIHTANGILFTSAKPAPQRNFGVSFH